MAKSELSTLVADVNRAARSIFNTVKKACPDEKLPKDQEAGVMETAQRMAFEMWRQLNETKLRQGAPLQGLGSDWRLMGARHMEEQAFTAEQGKLQAEMTQAAAAAEANTAAELKSAEGMLT